MKENQTFSKQFKTFFERHGKAFSLSCFCIFTAFIIGMGAVYTFKKANAEKDILKSLNENLGEDGIRVDISGAVNAAGSYDLPRGSRLSDAIDAAGGLSADADEKNINLSGFVEDGEKIIIPSETDTAQNADGKININAASAHDLASLNGIGEVTAQKIIDYREANGPFWSLSQLKEIEGIGEKTFDSIKDSITLE